MKGSLKGESPRVHFSAEFQDNHSGKIKRFTFEGDHESLKSAIKRFDANEFFRE
ncbi:hypothetical protein PSEUDO8BK_40548 [Pseudomonas sp. 8BK]|nr:hypothetical protein PSEUDO8BK_40548 [Pseudomonas sp. 8BK]